MKNAHNGTVVLLTLLTLIAISFIGCSPNEPAANPPEPEPEIRDTLTLTFADKTHRSVTLNVKTTANAEGYAKNKIKLIRKLSGGEGQDTLVAEYSAATLDTTIIDDADGEGLLLETSYVYYAVRIDSANTEKDSSAFLTAQTLGATSHDYTWEEIIIGDDGYSNALYDVWGTDENNVYAVGSVKIDGVYYGIIHWDGEKWEGSRKKGGQYAIFGFSENDIWSVGASVNHFDGNTWTKIDDNILQSNIEYRAVWGTSSENLYFGNYWGKIVHWDGRRGSLMDFDDEKQIFDIWGNSSNEIYIVTGNALTREGTLYLYNGLNFKEITDGVPYPIGNELRGPFYTTWSDMSKNLFIGGHRIYSYYSGLWNEEINFQKEIYSIRGKKVNDLFVCGSYGLISHYNGVEWFTYSNAVNTNSQIIGLVIFETDLFLCGYNGNNAIIIQGKKGK